MSSDNTGRAERTTANTSPMGSTIAILVAIAAVVVGFFIMNNIRGDSDANAPANTSGSTASTVDPALSTTVPSTTPAPPALTYEGTSVQVANSARMDGVAGKMSDELEAAGFTMIDPVNGDDALDTTIVLVKDQNDAAMTAVARTVAYELGVGQVTPSTEEGPPTATGEWPDGVGVIVLLGKDFANKTLAELGPDAGGATPGSTTTATTAAGATTATTAAAADTTAP
jgi:hypothetical protein